MDSFLRILKRMTSFSQVKSKRFPYDILDEIFKNGPSKIF